MNAFRSIFKTKRGWIGVVFFALALRLFFLFITISFHSFDYATIIRESVFDGYSSIPAQVMTYYLAPSVLSLERSTSLEEARHQYFSDIGLKPPGQILLDSAGERQGHALATAFDYPVSLFFVLGKSGVAFFTRSGALDLFSSIGAPSGVSRTMAWLFGGFWFFASILFFIRLFVLSFYKEWTPPLYIFVVLVLYFCLTTFSNGFAVNARFRFLVYPFLLVFAFEQARAFFRSRTVRLSFHS